MNYGHHADKPFFGELIEAITAGPVVMGVLEGPGAIAHVRNLIGATDPLKAAPGTIRGDFALQNPYNMVHASDSPETARAEIARFFGDGDGKRTARRDAAPYRAPPRPPPSSPHGSFFAQGTGRPAAVWPADRPDSSRPSRAFSQPSRVLCHHAAQCLFVGDSRPLLGASASECRAIRRSRRAVRSARRCRNARIKAAARR